MTSNRLRPPAKSGELDPLGLVRRWFGLISAAGRQAFLRLLRSEDLTYASSIAYYALVSPFPLLLFAGSVLARFTDSEVERAAVTDVVLRIFPEQVGLVANQLEDLSSAGAQFGLVGMVILTWVSLGIFRVGLIRHQIVANWPI